MYLFLCCLAIVIYVYLLICLFSYFFLMIQINEISPNVCSCLISSVVQSEAFQARIYGNGHLASLGAGQVKVENIDYHYLLWILLYHYSAAFSCNFCLGYDNVYLPNMSPIAIEVLEFDSAVVG